MFTPPPLQHMHDRARMTVDEQRRQLQEKEDLLVQFKGEFKIANAGFADKLSMFNARTEQLQQVVAEANERAVTEQQRANELQSELQRAQDQVKALQDAVHDLRQQCLHAEEEANSVKQRADAAESSYVFIVS